MFEHWECFDPENIVLSNYNKLPIIILGSTNKISWTRVKPAEASKKTKQSFSFPCPFPLAE